MYECESWSINKAEHWRIIAFEPWCWRRLLRVPWTARRSNQSILKEISPGCSLEGLVLKLKPVLWPPHVKCWLIWKDTDAGEDWRREEKGITAGKMGGWHHQLDGDGVWAGSGRWWRTGKPGVLQDRGSQRGRREWGAEHQGGRQGRAGTQNLSCVDAVNMYPVFRRYHLWLSWWHPGASISTSALLQPVPGWKYQETISSREQPSTKGWWQLVYISPHSDFDFNKPRQHIKKQRHHFSKKGPSSQGYGFSSGHVWMWELDHKESWAPKNWCFWTMVLEKTLESLLDSKEIQPVHPRGNQSWILIERTDAEAEAPILWPPDVKSQLTGKDYTLSERVTRKNILPYLTKIDSKKLYLT